MDERVKARQTWTGVDTALAQSRAASLWRDAMRRVRLQLQLQSPEETGQWYLTGGPALVKPPASATARGMDPACCNLVTSLQPGCAAPLSGEKTAGEWNTSEQTLLRALWAPEPAWGMG